MTRENFDAAKKLFDRITRIENRIKRLDSVRDCPNCSYKLVAVRDGMNIDETQLTEYAALKSITIAIDEMTEELEKLRRDIENL